MELTALLSRLEKLEESVAGLYGWLAEVFADDQEVSAFFSRMKLQETSHAGLVRYERRLVRSAGDSFEDLDLDAAPIEELEGWIREFREGPIGPSLGQALLFSMKVESHAAESLHRDAMTRANPDLRALIDSLSRADRQHFEELKRFAADHADALDDL